MEQEIIAGRKALAFTQIPHWVLLSGVSARAVQLYTLYHMHANGQRGDGQVWPSRAFLAWAMGMSKGAKIDRYNKELVQLGAIDIRKKKHLRGWHNIITVHETPPEAYTGSFDLTQHHATYRQLMEG